MFAGKCAVSKDKIPGGSPVLTKKQDNIPFLDRGQDNRADRKKEPQQAEQQAIFPQEVL